jgi:hypothetical protein
MLEEHVVVDAGETVTISVDCHPGDKATGGGFTAAFGSQLDMGIPISAPRRTPLSPEPIGWEIRAVNSSSAGRIAVAYVVCADTNP